MGHPTHRRGGYPGVSVALVVAVLVAFGLGWTGASLTRADTPPPSATAPPTAAPVPTATETSSPPVTPVGFAQPTVSVEGLEVMSVLTKIKGGVDVTLLVQNHGNSPITVDNTDLGPHDVTFRGQPVSMEMAPAHKKLVPGESLVYPCRVHLPDMDVGELSFTVGGVPISGPAAGD